MALDKDEIMRIAQERLRQAEDRLAQTRKKVEETRVTVRSADNVIAAVVDGQGELISITFNSAKWRRMAPAELGAALVKTINKARQDAREELMRSYSGMVPEPLLSSITAGRISPEEIFNTMVRRITPS